MQQVVQSHSDNSTQYLWYLIVETLRASLALGCSGYFLAHGSLCWLLLQSAGVPAYQYISERSNACFTPPDAASGS